MVLILCSVLLIIKCIYIHECFKIQFVSEFSYFIYIFNTKDFYNCLSLIEPCHEKFAFWKIKVQISLMVIMQLFSSFVYDSTMFVLQKTTFQASSHLENQSVSTRAGDNRLAFDIINEHRYTPCLLWLFQTVKSLNIFTLTTILDSMHIIPPNTSRFYFKIHSFIIKEYY